MRDLNIREQAAVCQLAVQLYQADALFYERPVEHWDALSRGVRDIWIERAFNELESYGPSRPTRWQEYDAGCSGKVIGRISESAPWGDAA